jgi:hypothetical protein
MVWLILELQNHEFLNKPAKQNWQMLADLFVVRSKKISTEPLKVLKKNLASDLKQESKARISQIISGLV